MSEDRVVHPSGLEVKECEKHIGAVVEYEVLRRPGGSGPFGCPLCEAEARLAKALAQPNARHVVFRFDEQHIPQVVDSIAESLAIIATRSEVISVMLAEIKRALTNEKTDPKCPKCGGDMKVVQRKDGSGAFWSCLAYPKCNGTRSLDDPKDKQGDTANGPVEPTRF